MIDYVIIEKLDAKAFRITRSFNSKRYLSNHELQCSKFSLKSIRKKSFTDSFIPNRICVPLLKSTDKRQVGWLGGFYGISTLIGCLMPNTLYTYILNIYDLDCWVLWNINPCRLFNTDSSLFIYIIFIGFGLVWFGLVLWHINHCRLSNAKYSLYIYIKYIWFGLADFFGISTIVGYLMPNSLYTYILNIYNLVWFGFMAYQRL